MGRIVLLLLLVRFSPGINSFSWGKGEGARGEEERKNLHSTVDSAYNVDIGALFHPK